MQTDPPYPRLILVPGEPAGIGPELCVRIAQQPRHAHLTILADPALLHATAQQLRMPLQIHETGGSDARADDAGHLRVQALPLAAQVHAGRIDPRNASYVLEGLQAAARACLAGDFDGMVTGPVQKSVLNAAGHRFTGTTELLAGLCGVDVLMMLATDALRVALLTTHLPLREVPDAITKALLQRGLRILERSLRTDFGIELPRIAVLGLNPHAGEAGHLGREEIEIIEPVLQRLRSEGMQLHGPLPADTAFLPARLRECDAVLSMYHDQGLPVLKHTGFEHAVNITLGLPFPRVAVDHGTALDLAGKGVADPSSLSAAVRVCTELAQRRRASGAAGPIPAPQDASPPYTQGGSRTRRRHLRDT